MLCVGFTHCLLSKFSANAYGGHSVLVSNTEKTNGRYSKIKRGSDLKHRILTNVDMENFSMQVTTLSIF